MIRTAIAMLIAAAPAPMTAEEAIAAAKAVTRIGRDSCHDRDPREIVVCGRRERRYALPPAEPVVDSTVAMSGRAREETMERMKDAAAPCRLRGEPCMRGLPIITSRF